MPGQWSWIGTLTLLPIGGSSVLSVAWTLQHELAFYVSFAIIVPSLGLWALAAFWGLLGVAGIVLLQLGVDMSQWGMLSVAANPININFVYGIVAFIAYKKGLILGSSVSIAAAVISILTFVGVGSAPSWSFTFGLSLGVLLFKLVTLETSNDRLPLAKLACFCGDTSYALYLCHIPILVFCSWTVSKVLGELSWYIFFPAVCLACLVGAAVYFVVYERRIMKFSRILLEVFSAPARS